MPYYLRSDSSRCSEERNDSGWNRFYNLRNRQVNFNLPTPGENSNTTSRRAEDPEDSEILYIPKMVMREFVKIDRKATSSKVPHSWLCNGTLLRLMDPTHNGNYFVFQRVWKVHYPLIISNVTKKLDRSLWHPCLFSHNFGDATTDFINCLTGEILKEMKMQSFWDGFEDISKRIKDDEGNPMFLKLKGWPPCISFHAILPFHMKDLVDAFPLSAYTAPNGLLNFVNYLPNGFLTQEVGTELLCAYGDTEYLSVGTVNLGRNIVDTVNMLVYVGNTRSTESEIGDTDTDQHHQALLQALRELGCDNRSLLRVRNGDNPGAVWHVFNIKHIKKIQDFLIKVSLERGFEAQYNYFEARKLYLDSHLRTRLQREYHVKPITILQCEGDAVFIPAGALYQVRNLKSCINVKHDFVSLQNVKNL